MSVSDEARTSYRQEYKVASDNKETRTRKKTWETKKDNLILFKIKVINIIFITTVT